MKESINSIMKNFLLTGDPAKKRALDDRSADKQAIQEIIDSDDFAQRMEEYLHTDKEEAYEEMRQRLKQANLLRQHPSMTACIKPLLRYAASILVLIAAGAGIWWNADYTQVTPPEIAQEIRQAMIQSEESGKSAAVVDKPVNILPKDMLSNDTLQQLTQAYEDIQENYELEDLKRISTVHDKEFWVTLDDGTFVHLNNNSKIIYPEKFGRKNREVIIEGEAYFMVAKDKSRPFVVHTPDGDITVHGTEFNVNTRVECLMDENTDNNSRISSGEELFTTEVVLTKGSISASMKGNEVLLKPGQKVVFDTRNTSFNISEVDTEPYVAWNTGKFVFNDVALGKVMDILSRWYRLKTAFESDDLRNIKLYSNFDRYGDIEPIIKGIGIVTGLDIQIHDNTITVKK